MRQRFPCPRCGSQNPVGYKFCGACGSRFIRYCPYCGGSVTPGHRFCGDCGARLLGNDNSVPPPTQVAGTVQRWRRLRSIPFIVAVSVNVVVLLLAPLLISSDSQYLQAAKSGYIATNLAAIVAYTVAFWWAPNATVRRILIVVIGLFIFGMIYQLLSLIIMGHSGPG